MAVGHPALKNNVRYGVKPLYIKHWKLEEEVWLITQNVNGIGFGENPKPLSIIIYSNSGL